MQLDRPRIFRLLDPLTTGRQRARWIRTAKLVVAYLAIHLAAALAISAQPTRRWSADELARAAAFVATPADQGLPVQGSPSAGTLHLAISAQADTAPGDRRTALRPGRMPLLGGTGAPRKPPSSSAVVTPDPSDQIARMPESKAGMDQDRPTYTKEYSDSSETPADRRRE
jgi:hypothetical protein